MNTDQKYHGTILSFYELIDSCNIEIPIIQRDYAQGRENVKEIRNNFLNALYDSVSNNNQLKLDFIYGSKVSDSFYPLDGQQRLTTLFLLHWYAAIKDSLLDDKLKNKLKKFSYETRISSRDFCLAITGNKINISKEDTSVSDIIVDSSWFYLSWKNDPTISAMLIMIDDIHNLFYKIDNLWDKLTSNNKPLISFYYVELEHIGLTDDLYIKMNARGKLLSPFENFKAAFQKHIKNNQWENKTSYNETFALKIDTKWSDLFWSNFRNANKSIDHSLIRFISTIAMVRYALEKKDDRIINITKINDDPNSIKPELFTEDGFKYLYKCFDLYCNIVAENIDLSFNYPLWRHKPTKDFLTQIVLETENASYTQKVLFYAQTEYLIHNEVFDKNKFEDWMRVVRNIVSRGSFEVTGNRPDIIRSPQTFEGVINLIAEIAEGSNDIYTHLASSAKINSTFARSQVEEERLKSNLFSRDDSNEIKSIIHKLEDNDLLMGRIEFALYCADFNNNDINSLDIDKFRNVEIVINKYISKETDLSNDLRRGLLTIENDGNYEFYNYWWSFWYAGNAHKRCLIDKFRVLEYYIYGDYKIYLKKLITKLVNSSLAEIINDFIPPTDMPNWKIRLIKESLLDKNTSNYIAIPEDNSYCYLLKSKRPRDTEGSDKIK